jgi:hypothetical protein
MHVASTKRESSYSEIWKAANPNARVLLRPSIRNALNSAKQIGEQENGMRAFITGSGFLVSLALKILEKKARLES